MHCMCCLRCIRRYSHSRRGHWGREMTEVSCDWSMEENRNMKDFKSLCLLCLRLFSASGDMRTNGDNYLYEIQLSSITSSTNPACSGANICQVKPNDQHFSRKVGTSDRTKYYIQGNLLLPVSGSCAAFRRESCVCSPTNPLRGNLKTASRTKALCEPVLPWWANTEGDRVHSMLVT